MTEAEACDALMWSYQSRGLDLGCYTTVHTCPNHIRIPHGGAACMSYDAASVVECVHLWGAAATCVRLVAAADCTAVPVDGDGC